MSHNSTFLPNQIPRTLIKIIIRTYTCTLLLVHLYLCVCVCVQYIATTNLAIYICCEWHPPPTPTHKQIEIYLLRTFEYFISLYNSPGLVSVNVRLCHLHIHWKNESSSLQGDLPPEPLWHLVFCSQVH